MEEPGVDEGVGDALLPEDEACGKGEERTMPRAARGGESVHRDMDRVRMTRASMSQKPPR